MEQKYPEPAAFSKTPRPPIELQGVKSSQVKAIGYDEATKTLAVQFTRGTGAVYHYPNVEKETYDAFVGAESIGVFFGQEIKNLPFEKFMPEAEVVEAGGQHAPADAEQRA